MAPIKLSVKYLYHRDTEKPLKHSNSVRAELVELMDEERKARLGFIARESRKL